MRPNDKTGGIIFKGPREVHFIYDLLVEDGYERTAKFYRQQSRGNGDARSLELGVIESDIVLQRLKKEGPRRLTWQSYGL